MMELSEEKIYINAAENTILGAEKSVDLYNNGKLGQTHFLNVRRVMEMVSAVYFPLSFNYVLGLPKVREGECPMENVKKIFDLPSVTTSIVEIFCEDNFVIIDKDLIAIKGSINTISGKEKVTFIENRDEINELKKLFDAHHPRSETYLIYDDKEISARPSKANEIIGISSEYWSNLIRVLSADPKLLYSLSPRKFEELIAELLIREGLEARLTPISKDGGRDILAFLKTPVGKHLYFVECKRYAPDKTVGVSLVRSLYGVIEAENATAGMLITTSRFTQGAVSFCSNIQSRMSLKDFNDIKKWLNSQSIK